MGSSLALAAWSYGGGGRMMDSSLLLMAEHPSMAHRGRISQLSFSKIRLELNGWDLEAFRTCVLRFFLFCFFKALRNTARAVFLLVSQNLGH